MASDLAVTAARYVLGAVTSDDMARLADDILANGTYLAVADELASMRCPTMADAAPLFERMLAELGAQLPLRGEAMNTLLRHHIERIASRAVPPDEGLDSLVRDVYYPAVAGDEASGPLGNAYGLEVLMADYYNYDDVREWPPGASYGEVNREEAMSALERDIVRDAQAWLAARPA